MKTDRYTLVYDDKCPLCAAYTKLFVKTGILGAAGRRSFSDVETTLFEKFDVYRGRNEIPLLDTQTGTVYYGIDALLELLGQKMPWIKTIGRFGPLYWFLKKLYRFISYNRKVIVAVKCGPGRFDCSPAFSLRWRLLFLLVFLCLNTLALFPVQKYVLANSVFSGASPAYVQALHALLVGSNLLLAATLNRYKAMEYIGQVNVLAIISTALLMLLAGFNKYVWTDPLLNNAALLLMLLFIGKEYTRRMTYAGTLRNLYVTGINIICITGFIFLLLR
ncbi:MAG: DUF393 domain-containing protein [Ferruginibacter sp.]|nr:DUF393 domain-containing protein [Ferruginibacter sp.]